MKTRKMYMLAALFLVAFSLTLLPAMANATVDVYSASIERLGFYPNITPESSGGIVFLIDNATSPAWTGSRMFYLSSDLGNQGLATLLTAFSMGKPVFVRISGDAEAGSLITIIYVNE